MSNKKQTINEFIKELSSPDIPFEGTRINEDKLSKYERIRYFANEIKANENYFINVHIECDDEIPNNRRNGIVIVNMLAPVNINNAVIKDCLSEMIREADNFTVAITERDGHKIVRFGFGIRDIWANDKNMK